MLQHFPPFLFPDPEDYHYNRETLQVSSMNEYMVVGYFKIEWTY
jgi:hypothetical protein